MSGLSDGYVNPATQHVTEQQRAQALSEIQKLSNVMGQQQQKPILKLLREMGIEPKYMTVVVGDIPTDCIVIPKQELMSKEYAYLAGVPLEQLEGNVSGETSTEVG